MDFGINGCEDDNALLVAKRAVERQLRRLKKVDASTGIHAQSDFQMDLYFQEYAGQQMHAGLESVLR